MQEHQMKAKIVTDHAYDMDGVMERITVADTDRAVRDARTSDGYACEKPVKGGLSEFGRMIEAVRQQMGV
jgi:hypothetical protein